MKQRIFDTKFDFFTLSETWLTEDYPSSLLHINGYNLVRLDRKWLEPNTNRPKKGGGVAMYIKNNLSIVTTNVEHLDCSSVDIEILWVKVINTNHRNYIVVKCYRPPPR